MSVDAGTIYSGVRVKLDALNRDVKAVQSEFDKISGAVGKTKSSTNALNNEFSKLTKSIVSGQLVYDGIKRAMGAVVDFTKEAITASIDAQETFGKYDEVFEGMGEQSEEAAQRFAKAFDLAGVTAKDMLSNTGNLLQGFGATKRESLEMAEAVNTLASDLASFTNYSGGAKGASEALTKALLGERESAKGLGIAILESDVQVELARKGQQGLTGEALKLAKAQATLEIITRQAKNSIGDYARTSDSASNTLKRAKESTLELKVALGTQLNPATTLAADLWNRVANGLTKVIERKQGAGELTVATDELITATNNYKLAVNLLNTDSGTLSETEKGLIQNRKELASLDIQASLNALSKGYATTNSKILKLDNDRIASGKLVSVNLKRIADLEIAIAQKSEKQKKKDKGTIDDLDAALISARQSATIYNKQQIDADRALTTLKAEQKTAIQGIAKAYKDGLIDISSYKNTNFELYDAIIRTSRSIGIVTVKTKEATDATEEAEKARLQQLKLEQEAAERVAEQIKGRKEAQEEYNTALDKTSYSLSKNLITEEDANKANLNAATKYIDALYKLGYASESEIGTIGYNALQSLIEKYPELIALTKEAKYETNQFGLGFEELAETERKLATAAVSMFTDASAAIAMALAEGENGWSAFGKAGLNAIASLLDAIAIEIEALAVKQILLYTLFNPAGWAAAAPFIAKGVAVSASAGVVRGWAGTFQTGGIVPGSSYTGDNMLASVNSGEMILNQQQQARLWNELSGLRNGANGGNITVVSVLDGKKVSRSVTRRQRTNNA